jgi:hypothetical protein
MLPELGRALALAQRCERMVQPRGNALPHLHVDLI